METILEPKFHDTSHGFRPSRGCHTALRQVKNWRGVPWIIEGDIKSFFDMIDHHILENLLSKHFVERHLFNLFWKFVKAGYIEFNDKKQTFISPDKGVPQGGILSPLLSNVILHELDMYMEKRKLQYQSASLGQKPMIVNKAYTKLTTIIKKCKVLDQPKMRQEARRLRDKTRYELPNPNYIQMEYVRYADDWLVGVWGPLAKVRSLKTDIAIFLQSLKLSLSEEKTLITNTRRGRVKFLGTHIYKLTPTKGSLSHPTMAGTIRMNAPLKILAKRLRERHFWKPTKTGPKALGIPSWIGWPIKELILRFRAILNGLLNFYSHVDNRGSLAYIYFILHGSLRNTICRKLNIGFREFYHIYGPKISITIYNMSSFAAKNG